MVFLDEEIRIDYAGIPYNHGDREGYYTKVQSMGYATLRPDGFTKISCQEKGELLTRPFSIIAPDIYLNCDSSKGAIQIELLEEDGTVIEGFDKENCKPISEDNTRRKLSGSTYLTFQRS